MEEIEVYENISPKGDFGDILFPEESCRGVGACLEVHKELGCGFLEDVYQEALELELNERKIPFMVQPKRSVCYKGRKLKQFYRPDFVCFGKIILEIKNVSEIADIHKAQLLNYLRATHMKLGLLVNFNSQFLKPVRVLNLK